MDILVTNTTVRGHHTRLVRWDEHWAAMQAQSNYPRIIVTPVIITPYND